MEDALSYGEGDMPEGRERIPTVGAERTVGVGDFNLKDSNVYNFSFNPSEVAEGGLVTEGVGYSQVAGRLMVRAHENITEVGVPAGGNLGVVYHIQKEDFGATARVMLTADEMQVQIHGIPRARFAAKCVLEDYFGINFPSGVREKGASE